MAHLLSIMFFFGLLVALAALLETMFLRNKAAIMAALRPVDRAPARQRGPRAVSVPTHQ